MPRSRRGLLESNPITVSAHPEVARCLRDANPTWLDAAASAALGVPPDLHASAIPILVAGETLGLVVFVFSEVEPHDEDNGRLLTAVSAAMGFALLRDRLAQELREAAGAPDRTPLGGGASPTAVPGAPWRRPAGARPTGG
jgi:GAF domain-containing protein